MLLTKQLNEIYFYFYWNRTDAMQSQYRALHCSASRGKNVVSNIASLWPFTRSLARHTLTRVILFKCLDNLITWQQKMSTKTLDVFIQRQSAETFEVEDEGQMKTMTTMADSVRPLLTSMKLFGLYFRSRREAGDNVTDEKSRRPWNGYMIYALVVTVILWINLARMFSVFKNIGLLVWSLLFHLLCFCQTQHFAETSLILSCLMSFFYFFEHFRGCVASTSP